MRLCTGLMYSAVRGQVTLEREGRGAVEFPLPELEGPSVFRSVSATSSGGSTDAVGASGGASGAFGAFTVDTAVTGSGAITGGGAAATAGLTGAGLRTGR